MSCCWAQAEHPSRDVERKLKQAELEKKKKADAVAHQKPGTVK